MKNGVNDPSWSIDDAEELLKTRRNKKKKQFPRAVEMAEYRGQMVFVKIDWSNAKQCRSRKTRRVRGDYD